MSLNDRESENWEMASASAEQVVVVGKMSILQAQGRISLSVLPQSLSWLERFSAEQIADFFAELLDAVGDGEPDRDWTQVSGVLERWKTAAESAAGQGMGE